MRAPNIVRIKLVGPGTALDHNNVATAYKRAGLPSFRLYDLRHTFASALLVSGTPISYVSHQLEHQSASTTLTFYAKWLPSGEQNLAALLDAPSVFTTPEGESP